MLLGFFDLFFELSLPFFSSFLFIPVFLELSSSTVLRYANLYHRCAVFLVPSFSPALPGFPESFVFFYSHCVSRSWLLRMLLLPVCTMPCLFSNNTQAISRLDYMCSFDFLHDSFSQDSFHSIPHIGFAALRSFCLLVQKLSLYLLLAAVATPGFCFVSQTSSVSLLSTS